MLPGVSGFRPMPRKMAGIAMITIDASIVAIVMLSVVLDRAIHRYLSGRCAGPEGRPPGAPWSRGGSIPPVPPWVPFTWPESTLCRTFTQSTAKHLLDSNYLSGGSRGLSISKTVAQLEGLASVGRLSLGGVGFG